MACFTQFREKVPAWIEDTNKLMIHVHTKRAEFAADSSMFSRKRKALDTASTRSRHTVRTTDEFESLQRLHSMPKSTAISAGSKRQKMGRVGSTLSTRKNEGLVVSYDAHTQKVLEDMVRQIWSAKSSIRAARISQSIRTALRGRQDMDLSSRKRADTNAWVDKHDRRCKTKECPFDFVEGQLDAAQDLCECGAYRFLREGDCLDELDGMVQAFEMILEASETMAEQMETEAEEASSDDRCPSRTMDVGSRTRDADDPSKLEDTILEVDDNSSTSSVAIDISAFRLNRFGRAMHSFPTSHHR
jgi:hypothetical protein